MGLHNLEEGQHTPLPSPYLRLLQLHLLPMARGREGLEEVEARRLLVWTVQSERQVQKLVVDGER